MYFLRRKAPIHLTAERAAGLRRSLNSPVVSSPELPSGPARAAILVHREPLGRLAVSIGVRSLKSAHSAVWTCDADLDEMTTVDVAVDAALSFAEGMGFLFDDEEPGNGRKACAGWHEMMGDAVETETERVLELELTELIEPEAVAEPSDALAGEVVESGDSSQDLPELADGAGFDLEQATFEEAEPRIPLSKFRGRLPAGATEPTRKKAAAAGKAGASKTKPGPDKVAGPRKAVRRKALKAKAETGKKAGSPNPRAALGKLKLVKRRGNPTAARRSWLQRVLSSF